MYCIFFATTSWCIKIYILSPCHVSPWFGLEGEVLGLGLECQVLGLGLAGQVLGLGAQVLGLGLAGQVLVNITDMQ